MLQDLAYGVAGKLGLTHKVRRGVCCFVSGRTYETPTEARFLRLVGCDAVGMNTAPEAIVAAHCGLKNIGLSIITNKALFPGEKGTAACHEEVIETIQATQRDIETFVQDLITAIGKQQDSLCYSFVSYSTRTTIFTESRCWHSHWLAHETLNSNLHDTRN